MPFVHLRQTLRRLSKSRGFSVSIVVILALGIGATVSVFSIIQAVLIEPLPYPHPSELFSIFQTKRANDVADIDGFSPANFLDFHEQNRAFTDLAAYCGFHFNLTGRGQPRHLRGVAVSQAFFPLLGVQPGLGRNFLPEEDRFSSAHVVVLSHSLWSTEFRADLHIVGKAISLNGDPYIVIGVMPRNFHSPEDEQADLWIPLQQQIRPDRMLIRDLHFLGVIGRLRPDVTLDQARADMNRIAAQLGTQYPGSDNGTGAVVMPLQQALVGDTKKSLLLALGIVLLVLLIASFNAAILMLARVTGRTRDLAVRMALGAGSAQILRDIVAESAILGLISGLLGTFLALAGRQILLVISPYDGNIGLIQLNFPVLAFAVAVSTIVGVGLGLIPAVKILKMDVQRVLRSSGNATTLDTAGRLIRHSLLIGEISLSIVLLVATGLLFRSMAKLQHQPLGFRTNGVNTLWIGLPRIRYQNNDDVAAFFAKVERNLRDSANVDAVGLGYPLPLQGNHFWTSLTIAGRQTNLGEYDQASLRFVSAGFLPLMGIPILEGRNFTEADDAKAEGVALVSQSFAHKYWPGESALGKYIAILRDKPIPRRIIGVVGDVRATIEDDPPPSMYVSFKQLSFPSMQIVMVNRGSSDSGLTAIRQAVQSVDPNQPVEGIESMDEIVRSTLDPWRFAFSLLGGLAGLATVLTGIGLFAVVCYLVRERTRELGLRMAMGASRQNVLQLVMRQSLKLALLGSGLGFLLTIIVARSMTTMVYAVSPNDPAIFIAVAAFVVVISFIAAYVPARRASRIEPLTALREE